MEIPNTEVYYKLLNFSFTPLLEIIVRLMAGLLETRLQDKVTNHLENRFEEILIFYLVLCFIFKAFAIRKTTVTTFVE
jgi:hypothetical protein